MLVELHIDEKEVERIRNICLKESLDYDCNPTIFSERGFYDEYYEMMYKETANISFNDAYKALEGYNSGSNEYRSQYGVADSIEQIQEYFKEQIEDPDTGYVIGLSRIDQDKKNSGKGGGWRWHKWGPYIGNLNPQCEYLDDEDFGDDFQGFVICFHLKKVLPLN